MDVQAKFNLASELASCVQTFFFGMTSTHQTADDSAHVEYNPEPGDKSAFESLRRIRHYDRALRGPENAGTASKQEAREDNVTEIVSVVVAQIRADIDTVSKATEREGKSDAQGVGDGTGEETDNSESCVERGV